jgi:hypothetical protein
MGCISHDCKLDLVTIWRNWWSVLQRCLTTSCCSPFRQPPNSARPVFMDDNARPHRSMAVKWNETVTSLPWPVMDPDLIPIEHVWDMLNHRLQAVETHYTKLTSVGSSIASVWAAAFLLMYFVKPLKCHNRSHLCFWDYLVRNFMTLIVSFVV